MHPFDEWFQRVYPAPQPAGVHESALIAWNAAVHEVDDVLQAVVDRLVHGEQYERALGVRDAKEVVRTIARQA